MKTYLLTIGDELLIGQITDTNAAWIGQQLQLNGHIVMGKMTVGDEITDIQAALEAALSKADLVLITGGLGATKDDVTKKALCTYFGTELVFDEVTYSRLERFFAKSGRTVSEMNRQCAYLPSNATILLNEKGLAPGMWFDYDGKVIVSMPGVPTEMKYLMEYQVLPRLKASFPVTPVVHRTIQTWGEGETIVAERIKDFENNLPAYIKLAYLPDYAQVRLRLSGTGPDEKELIREIEEQKSALLALIPDIVFGFEDDTLPIVVGRMLKERGLTLSTAESCTGGYIAHLLTLEPGASGFYQGSIIAYANEVKTQVLGVSPATLSNHGAVSEQTVIEMVKGALLCTGSDLAIATSGIAGPDGGTPDKPVGTIWIAAGNNDRVVTQGYHLFRDRFNNIRYTTSGALNMLRKFLLAE